MRLRMVGSRNAWRIEAEPDDLLSTTLGPDAFALFGSCFIQADRLVSLNAFFKSSSTSTDTTPERERRDVTAFFAFVSGTFRELALVLPVLRGALRKKGFTKWPGELDAVEAAWGKHRRNIDIRDKLAFHVDQETLRAGLPKCSDKPLFVGSSSKTRDTWFPRFHFALYEGLSLPEDEILAVTKSFMTHIAVGEVLKILLVDCLEQAGVELVDERTSPSPGEVF